MRERAFTVAIAQRPNAGNAAPELIVDDDVSALVHRDAGAIQSEIICIRNTPDREQDMRAANFRITRHAVDMRHRLFAPPSKS